MSDMYRRIYRWMQESTTEDVGSLTLEAADRFGIDIDSDPDDPYAPSNWVYYDLRDMAIDAIEERKLQ